MTEANSWQLYDPAQHGRQAGNYVFLLDSFGNAPFYSGETNCFAKRFGKHETLYKTGGRTFFRPAFVAGSRGRTPADFAISWQRYKIHQKNRLEMNSFGSVKTRQTTFKSNLKVRFSGR